MKSEDAWKLKSLEQFKKLPLPNVIVGCSKEDIETIQHIQYKIYAKLFYGEEISSNSTGIESFKGKGSFKSPFKIQTKKYNGEFYLSRNIFHSNKYPTSIGIGRCHSNSYITAYVLTEKGINVEVVNGLSWYQFSACHSIVLIDNRWVVDYNWDLIIDYDLYKKMIPFEEIERISGDKIYNNHKIMKSCYHRAFEMLFAYEDCLKQSFKEFNLGEKSRHWNKRYYDREIEKFEKDLNCDKLLKFLNCNYERNLILE